MTKWYSRCKAWTEEVIIHEEPRGRGVEPDPHRIAIVVKKKNGDLIAVFDPWESEQEDNQDNSFSELKGDIVLVLKMDSHNRWKMYAPGIDTDGLIHILQGIVNDLRATLKKDSNQMS